MYLFISLFVYSFLCFMPYLCIYVFIHLSIGIGQIIATKPEGSPPDGGDSGSRNPHQQNHYLKKEI